MNSLSFLLINFLPARIFQKVFFNVGNGDINSTKGIIKYLGRYLARSPIAEYKITDITDKEVTFFFNDLANDKKKTYITMPPEIFISYILIHLSPKNFKMVNLYGFYSRHVSDRLKEILSKADVQDFRDESFLLSSMQG